MIARDRQLLTHSRLSCFRSCPRKHYLRYELALAPEEEAFALRVGTAFHAALEAADLGRDPEEAIRARGDLDAYDTAMVAAMFAVHQERWVGDTLSVVATELQFEIDVVNPETDAPSKLWSLAGKIDRIYRLPDGRLAIQDYKTTSDDITPGSDYWLRLGLDQQMSLYVIAARQLGYDVQTILYDVTVRPRHRPLAIAIVEDGAKVVIDAAGNRVRTKDGKKWRETADTALGYRLVTREETPEEFAARVAQAMREQPDAFFARHEIARLESDLDETRWEIWQQQQSIREAQRSSRWFRNPGACVEPYRCSYLGICPQSLTAESTPPQGFKRLASVHPELSGVPA